jgi:hypothetical protein
VQENQAPASATFLRQSAESNRDPTFGFEMANDGSIASAMKSQEIVMKVM